MVVLEVIYDDQALAEVAYVVMVISYDVESGAPLKGVVVMSAWASSGVEKVLMHAS